MTLAGYYNRQGHFDKTIEALEERAAKEPNNPEAFYTIADLLLGRGLPRLQAEGGRKEGLRREGHRRPSITRCSSSRTTSRRIVYKGLLLRLQANLEKDPAKQQQLLKDADRAQREGERDAQGEGRRHGALRSPKCRRNRPTTDWIERPPGSLWRPFFCTAVTTPAVKSPGLFEPIHFS